MAATVMTMMLNKKKAEAEKAGIVLSEAQVAANLAAELATAQAEAAKKLADDKALAQYNLDNPIKAKVNLFLDFCNNLHVQTILYLVFVLIFQCLTSTMRKTEEFYVDKIMMDRIVENHFDSSHNTLESVRRIADIYEWGNTVLWPGLFADLGPCDGDNIGSRPGGAAHTKTCNDETWPDGDGSFHGSGATPYDITELVEHTDRFDWSEGILFRQNRQKAMECKTTNTLGPCYPEYVFGTPGQESYGYNPVSPSSPLEHPFKFMSVEEAGGNPGGVMSAAIPSMRTYDTGGFIALVIPFFSETYLPSEEGTADEITNYRDSYVNTTNGRTPTYYCVRSSTNGYHIKQECDPGTNGDGTGALTGLVRAHAEAFWNDLKRMHYLDSKTRALSVVIQLKSNPLGIRYRINLMFESTSTGAVLPSFDVETRILDSAASRDMVTFAWLAFILVVFFSLLEGVEVAKIGIGEYVQDMWNVMDWANYIVYFMVFAQVLTVASLEESQPRCNSYLCTKVGYYDDWEIMSEFRTTKLYLSLCVCIQLFKVLKFASAHVPKMGLATHVLRVCALDMLFFGFTFVISMLAFSMMLYVQIGPVMEGYMGAIPALISLFRALFGDFDIDEIMNNSSGYLNTLLFLGYLFIAVFIMLSMFLAILAEGQVEVRRLEGVVKENDPDFKEYGNLTHASNFVVKMVKGVMKPATGGGADIAPAAAHSLPEIAAATASSSAIDLKFAAAQAEMDAEVDQTLYSGGGGGGGAGGMEELTQAIDMIGGMMIEMRSRIEANEAAVLEVATDVHHIGHVTQASHDGVMALGGRLTQSIDEVREGLGIYEPSDSTNLRLTGPEGSPPRGGGRASFSSPRLDELRMQSARSRTLFRALRAEQQDGS